MGTTAGFEGLSEREREILELIARGRTNSEIGETLGIRFDTAKWYVSEITSKLGVASREEAARVWAEWRSPGARLRRTFRVQIAGGLALKVAAGGVAGVAVLASGAIWLSLRSNSDPPPLATEPSGTLSLGSPTISGTTPPSATGTSPVASPATGAPRVQVAGLFNGAPPAGSQPLASTRALGARPASPFAPWNGTQGVIYDTETATEIELGAASSIVFSPDSTKAAWIQAALPNAGVATMMDLATGARRTFGDGAAIGFLDDRRIAVYQRQTSSWNVLDVDTATPSADQSIPADQASQPGFPSYPPSPDGYRWQVTPDESTLLTRGGTGKSSYRLIELATGAAALEFDAVFAAAAGQGEIVVATSLDGVMTNVFIVNIQTGKAEFIARVRYGRGSNWPLAATSRYVIWTENFCWREGVDPPQGHMQLYDRQSKTLIDIVDGVPLDSLQQESLRFARLTPGDLIALGSFGARALIDPISFEYTLVLPPGSPSFVNWSPDYHYAAYASGGGHGGLC